jgi:hypothetical protein
MGGIPPGLRGKPPQLCHRRAPAASSSWIMIRVNQNKASRDQILPGTSQSEVR